MPEVLEQKSIDVKDAVRRAFAYVAEVFPKEQLNDLRLEEVERSQTGDHWIITVGMAGTDYEVPAVLRGVGPRRARDYKQVNARCTDGGSSFGENPLAVNDTVEAILERSRNKSLLIDTNVLLLLLVGSFERKLIQAYRRTEIFAQTDFDLVLRLVHSFPSLVTTPHVLTEISNFLGQMGEPRRSLFFEPPFET